MRDKVHYHASFIPASRSPSSPEICRTICFRPGPGRRACRVSACRAGQATGVWARAPALVDYSANEACPLNDGRIIIGTCYLVVVVVGWIGDSVDGCTGTRYNRFMIRSIRHRRLRRLYEQDDPSRIAPEQLDRITLALADLDAAGKPRDLDLPGYRLHQLRGDRRGLWSISISGNWRITFRFEAGEVCDVDLVDCH